MESPGVESSLPGIVRYGAVVVAFVIFGIMPVYWFSLKEVNSLVILLHRAIWVAAILIPYVLIRSDLRRIWQLMKKNWHYLIISSMALASNWFGYIYAINHGYVIEAGLAYYIAPILSIALSLFFLKESIGRRQLLALILVFFAIIYLLVAKGVIPVFSLLIGCSFALYGVLSRVMLFPAVARLAIESLLISIGFFIFLQGPVETYHQFIEFPGLIQGLLIGAGLTTILSFSLYIASTTLVKFATIGVLGFILPTIVFFLGIFYFREPLDRPTLVSLLLIWMGIALYISALCKPAKNVQ